MYTTVTENNFHDAFKSMGRNDNFSYAGQKGLFEHLEGLDENNELDVISLCCEYTEYVDLGEFHSDYSAEDYPDISAIENETTVIRVNIDGFIIVNF